MTILIEENIIEIFILLINEFFSSINEYIDVNKLDNHTLFVITGINAVRNSFEYTIIKKRNLVSAKLYSQRSIYYFLEYIKQLFEVNMYLELDYTKISIFVNAKIINEINNTETNTLTNILSLTMDDEQILNININKMFDETNIFINNLFNWNKNSTIMDYQTICNNNLNILFKNYKNIKSINNYITLIKEKINIPNNENINVINSTCKCIANNKNKNVYLNIINKIYLNEDLLKDKYDKMKTNDFIYWLICHNNHS